MKRFFPPPFLSVSPFLLLNLVRRQCYAYAIGLYSRPEIKSWPDVKFCAHAQCLLSQCSTNLPSYPASSFPLTSVKPACAVRDEDSRYEIATKSEKWDRVYPASYPDVSLLMKMCAQRKAGRRQRARRLADLVFKMAARAMADKYAVFKISSALFILRILSKSLPIHVVCMKRKLLSPHTLDSSIIMFTNELHNVY